MKKLILISVLFLSVIGCTSAISLITNPIIDAGVQGYLLWKDGEATAYYATDANTAYAAVKRTLVELGYKITKDEPKSNNSYYVVAKSNDEFKVTIKQTENYVTAVKIRIDIMGDKPYAEMIYKKLEKQLDVIDFTKNKERWHLLKGRGQSDNF